MDNKDNPFGQPNQSEQNSQNQQGQSQPQKDQQMKANTFFDALKSKQEAEEQAKKELNRKLDRKIRDLRNNIWQQKKRIAKCYGVSALIGLGGGSFLGFFMGGKDNVPNDRRRTGTNDDRPA